jgi:hypothetical protein
MPEIRPRVLVVGVVLHGKPNLAPAIVRELQQSQHCEVVQRWAALGAAPDAIDPVMDEVLVVREAVLVPKFVLVNRVLGQEPLDTYAFVMVVDDDIELPSHFVDEFVARVRQYDLALAQPARTEDSYIDHHFVTALHGIQARATRFVEIGPLFCIRHEAFALLLPFDEASPMGWGYDFVWPHVLAERGLAMGIVDAVPVRHVLRAPVSNYTWSGANQEMGAYLARNPHVTRGEAFQIVRSWDGMPFRTKRSPDISVVLCTRNRSDLLGRALQGLEAQTLDRERWEVVVVDDGSEEDAWAAIQRFGSRYELRYFRQDWSGLAAARNHGVLAARAGVVVFADDDDVPSPGLLEALLARHQECPDENVAVLHHTIWSPNVRCTPFMDYIVHEGAFQFSYDRVPRDRFLDFSHFWGGRVSCKRELLLRYGLFNPVFRFGCEDIELAWRLRSTGLKVLYAPEAVTQMCRPVGLSDFCERLRRQGRSQWVFSCLHDSPEVRQWAKVDGARVQWEAMSPAFEEGERAARRLDELAQRYQREGVAQSPEAVKLLHEAYGWVCQASNIRGICEAMDGVAESVTPGACVKGVAVPREGAVSRPVPDMNGCQGPVETQAQLVTAWGEIASLREMLATARREVLVMQRSRSWQLTMPLRMGLDAVERWARWFRA